MAQIDIRWKDPDTIFSVFSDINRKLICFIHNGCQQSGCKFQCIMGFQICRLHCNGSISRSMALIKRIFGKINHLFPDLLCSLFWDPAVDTAVNLQFFISVDKPWSFLIHNILLLFTHSLTDQIGPSHGKTG